MNSKLTKITVTLNLTYQRSNFLLLFYEFMSSILLIIINNIIYYYVIFSKLLSHQFTNIYIYNI